MKFPTERGTGMVKGDQSKARECYVAELRDSRRAEKGKSFSTGGILRINQPTA